MSPAIRHWITEPARLARRRPARPVLGLIALCLTMACSGDDGASSLTDPTGTATPVVSSVSPQTLVEGASIVIRGTDFSSIASNNVVTIDGVAATVTAATPTQLAVTVPAFDCRPERDVSVLVSVGGRNSNALGASVRPASFVNVAVGKLLFIDEPAEFCLQFPAAPAGSGEYLVGVGAAAEKPADLLAVSLTAVQGHPAPAAAPAQQTSDEAQAPPRSRPPSSVPVDERWYAHARAEQRIRRWEREVVDPSAMGYPWPRNRDIAASLIASVPTVGEQLTFKVPTWDASTIDGVCTPIPITTVVRVVGQRAIFRPRRTCW